MLTYFPVGERKPEEALQERVDAALKASGFDLQVGEDGRIDAKAFLRAVHKRFPKVMAKLAE